MIAVIAMIAGIVVIAVIAMTAVIAMIAIIAMTAVNAVIAAFHACRTTSIRCARQAWDAADSPIQI